ncbi:MAG: hypothetical protein K0S32_3973 [Bacteroidetes bacterium]|jgi:hypothetical protein|nr:hypothetical protein [Bacteroidota bacterium]
MEKTATLKVITAEIKNLHEDFTAFSVKILAPVVFYFGKKESSWGLSITELLAFPEGSLGKELGNFYRKEKLDPIPGAESHDALHVLFGYSSSFKDEFALQFFLLGNRTISLAAIGTASGAWLMFFWKWRYFSRCYERGKQFVEISSITPREMLHQNVEEIRSSILKKSSNENLN